MFDYEYQTVPDSAFAVVVSTLDSLGYTYDIYTPESRFLTTNYRPTPTGFWQVDTRLIVQVDDVVRIIVAGRGYQYQRGSESSIGGGSQAAAETLDRLPYRVQQTVWQPLDRALTSKGFDLVNQRN